MPPSLAIATSNAGKLREFAALIGHAASLYPLPVLGVTLPEETGSTFEENARLKAGFVASATGLLTIADDSGLEVDALNGAPGVYSARFAGPHATDEENRAVLLERMKNIPPPERTARFVCVIAMVDREGNARTTIGTCEGSISMRETGSFGFGYDPVFMLKNGRTMAQLTSQEKNEISHRGVALRKSLPMLLSALPSGVLLREPPASSGSGP